MNKEIKVLSGTRNARTGGGYASFVVTSDDAEAIRGNYGLLPGASIKAHSVCFDVSDHTGAEGNITGYDYKYLVFSPSFDTEDSLVASAIRKHVMDDNYQSMLLKEHSNEA